MKVAVIGSRNFDDNKVLTKTLDSIDNFDIIVSGGAKGADKLGEQYAKERNIPIQIFLPDWKKYGKSAGVRRNKKIIDYCDIVVAFWDGKSKGTLHSLKLASKLKKKIILKQ